MVAIIFILTAFWAAVLAQPASVAPAQSIVKRDMIQDFWNSNKPAEKRVTGREEIAVAQATSSA
jgi:hypothetical protein